MGHTTKTIYTKKEEETQTTEEIKKVKAILKEKKMQLETLRLEIDAKQKEIDATQCEINQQISHMAANDKRFAVRTNYCFRPIPISDIVGKNKEILQEQYQVLKTQMEAMTSLKNNEQTVEVDMMTDKLKLMDLEIQNGKI